MNELRSEGPAQQERTSPAEREKAAERERFRRLGILVLLRNAEKPFPGITPEMSIEERLKIVEEHFEEFQRFIRQKGMLAFAFHGSGPQNLDFDARMARWFLQQAGIKIDGSAYLEAGNQPVRDRINIDVGGGLGISIPEGWQADNKTVVLEHHPRMGEQPSFSVEEHRYLLRTSAAEQVYKMLEALDLFAERDPEVLRKMAEFITQTGNKTHPQQFDPNVFRESWRTMMGLYYFISPDKLYELFARRVQPTDKLFSDGEPTDSRWLKKNERRLKQLGLLYQGRGNETVNWPARRREMIEKGLAEVKRKARNGMVVEIKIGEKRLKLIVDYVADIDPKDAKGIPLRTDAVIASGYNGVILYNEKTESYFINLDPSLSEELSLFTEDGVNVRGKMFIRDINQCGPLRISLAELIKRLGGDPQRATGGLREAIKNNNEWAKAEVVTIDDGSIIEWYEGEKNKPGHWGLPSGYGRKHGIITDGLPNDFNPKNEKRTQVQLRIYRDTKPKDPRSGAYLLKVIQIQRPKDYQEKMAERVESKIYEVEISITNGVWEAILPNNQRLKLPEKPEGKEVYDARFGYKIRIESVDGHPKVVKAEKASRKK